jgi:hypothetical protein
MYQSHFKWISFENTHVLLRHDRMGEIFEWTPVGQVTLRHIYAAHEPEWSGSVRRRRARGAAR